LKHGSDLDCFWPSWTICAAVVGRHGDFLLFTMAKKSLNNVSLMLVTLHFGVDGVCGDGVPGVMAEDSTQWW
jgi:hypothetical protein